MRGSRRADDIISKTLKGGTKKLEEAHVATGALCGRSSAKTTWWWLLLLALESKAELSLGSGSSPDLPSFEALFVSKTCGGYQKRVEVSWNAR